MIVAWARGLNSCAFSSALTEGFLVMLWLRNAFVKPNLPRPHTPSKICNSCEHSWCFLLNALLQIFETEGLYLIKLESRLYTTPSQLHDRYTHRITPPKHPMVPSLGSYSTASSIHSPPNNPDCTKNADRCHARQVAIRPIGRIETIQLWNYLLAYPLFFPTHRLH